MKRLSLFALLFLLLISSYPAIAQESVSVRIGEREGFARLVFGWPQAISYDRNDTDEGTFLKFKLAASPTVPDLSAFPYIQNFDIQSTDPLIVKIVTANGSSIRDFKIGKRVMLDIRPPEEVRNEALAQETSQPKAPEIKKQDVVNTDVKTQMPIIPPAEVTKIEKLENLAIVEKPRDKASKIKRKTQEDKPDTQEKAVSKAIKAAVKDDNHVFSVRSTKMVSVASFENNGRLWFVIDASSGYVRPQISSPKPELFSDVFREDAQNAKAYSVALPQTPMKMKATGGGLLWNIVIGDNVKPAKAVLPRREFDTQHSITGGKMIWPLKYVSEKAEVLDPVTGEKIIVVMVDDSSQFSGAKKSYVDFDLLRSPVGLAVRPKVDDLKVEITSQGVEISRTNGLILAPSKEVDAAEIYANQIMDKQNSDIKRGAHQDKSHVKLDDGHDGGHGKGAADENAFYQFNDWMMDATSESLPHKKTVILSTLNGKSDSRKVEDLLTLGKMYLAYGRGAEALGFFEYAASELPDLEKSPEFKALRGTASAIDWKSEAALRDLAYPLLNDYKEVQFWKAFVLADLGDWRQAAEVLPDNFSEIYNYPHNISSRLALVLAEVALRDGKVKKAQELITLVEHHSDELIDPFEAYLRYLKGEAARQKGQIESAKSIWKNLSNDKDDLYRTKSSLALTILRKSKNEIDNNQVINALERLRYAWRGDELEAQVKYWLGNAYFEKKDYLKGLNAMREGASVASGKALGERIAGDMSAAFSKLFLEDKLKDLTPLESVALYEEFSELTPVGEEGNRLVQILAEHLVKADLLPRASKILRHQIDHRLEGAEKVRVAIRLAAIQLMDKNPQAAVNALAKATNELKRISNKKTRDKYIREIAILKTKAYLQNKQYDKALSLINNVSDGKDARRLRADITWQAGYWGDAADAIHKIMVDEDITPNRPLSNEEADVILNRAIALSLDNDRIALSNLRQKFIGVMKNTHKARQFEVISRPRKDGSLADRETLLSVVSEVDMFKDFLDAYRNADSGLTSADDGKALHQ